jgi:SNF2 family DNA or RNA helicase
MTSKLLSKLLSKKKVKIIFEDESSSSENEENQPDMVCKKNEYNIVFDSSSDDEEESEGEESEEEPIEEFGEYNEFGVKMMKGYSLYRHQIEGINWMIEKEKNPRLGINGGIYSLYMGLGKSNSISTLCMIDNNVKSCIDLKYSNLQSKIIKDYIEPLYPCLVICSKTVAYEWKRDIKKFYGDSCPFFYFHKSSLKNKFDTIKFDDIKNFKIVISTYETVMNAAKKHKLADKQFFLDQFNRNAGILNSTRPLPSQTKSATGGLVLFKTPWKRIICDESHRMANPRSSTFFSMMCLYGEKKWCLSGTPLKNYTSDLYSQLRFCGYDQCISPNQFNYDMYQRSKLYEFILYKEYKDTDIKLPNIKEYVIEIELKDREKEIYDYYHGATKAVYNGFMIGSYNFSSVLTLFLRLRQICVCPYTLLAESSRTYKKEKEDKEYSLSQKILDEMTSGLASWLKDKNGTSGIYSSKIKEVINILKNIKQGEKTLVFTSFKKVIDIAVSAIKLFLPDKKFLVLDGDVTGDKRDDVLNNFKNGDLDYDVMFISYKVGSEGLNLVEANNIIMLENWWSPVHKSQAISRVHRIGQTKNVNVWHLIVKNSIEEKIETICNEKIKLIDDFLVSKKKFNNKLNATTIGRILK